MTKIEDLKSMKENVQIAIGKAIKMMDESESDVERLKLKMIIAPLKQARREIDDMLPAEKPPMSEEGKVWFDIANSIAQIKLQGVL